MSTEERIRRNREMEARIAARVEAERPAKEAAANRKLARAVTNLIFALPADMQRPAARIAVRAFRPDVAKKYGL